MAGDRDRPTLLTFAPMVDSELSRLLLEYYGVAYVERDHLLLRAAAHTFLHGGYGRVPLLYGRGVRRTGPWAIAKEYDSQTPEERRLIPEDGKLAEQVKADWKTYNGRLALATARFAYHHLLPLRELMTPLFAAPLPTPEANQIGASYDVLDNLLRLLLRISPGRADQALADIRAIFEETDDRVKNGQPFLCGNRITIGDLALCAAAAPLLLPPRYGAKMPRPELMPASLRKLVHELRARPTGAFVLRLYAERFQAPVVKD